MDGCRRIAGGTGFVGLNTAKVFAERGDQVVVTSRRRLDDGGEALATADPASNAIYPMTFNCLDGAASTGVSRVLLASPIAIYGGLRPPFDEDALFPTRPVRDPEGLRVPVFETVVKRTVEMIAFDFSVPMPAPTSGLAAVETFADTFAEYVDWLGANPY